MNFENVRITQIGRIIYVSENEYRERVTNFHGECIYNELIYHLSGSARVAFNGQTLFTNPGTVRFLPKGRIEEYRVERFEPGACIDIFFDTSEPVSDKAFVLETVDHRGLEKLFRKTFLRWRAHEAGYTLSCIGELYGILAELQKSVYVPETQYERIKPALSHIHAHFTEKDLRVEGLSAMCDMSGSYLKKLFLQKFSMTPKQYILKCKLDYACELLGSGYYSVGAVAEQCGYENAFYFSRAFKKMTGIAPSEYQQKYISSK